MLLQSIFPKPHLIWISNLNKMCFVCICVHYLNTSAENHQSFFWTIYLPWCSLVVKFQISCFFSHVQFLIVSQTSKLRFLNLFNCHKDAAVQRNTTKVAELWGHSADRSCVITEKPASNSIYLKHNKAKTWMIVSVEMMKRQPWEKQETETWWCTNNFKSQLKKKMFSPSGGSESESPNTSSW